MSEFIRDQMEKDEKELTGQASSASETASSAAIVVSAPLRSGLSSHAGYSRRYSPNYRHFPSTGNINYDHLYIFEIAAHLVIIILLVVKAK